MKTRFEKAETNRVVAAFSSVYQPLLIEIIRELESSATQPTYLTPDFTLGEALARNPDLVVFTWPEIAIARAILDGEAFFAALERWKCEVRLCLSTVDEIESRFISSIDAIESAPPELGVTTAGKSAEGAVALSFDPALVFVPAAALFLRGDTEVEALVGALEAATGRPRLKLDAVVPDFIEGSVRSYSEYRNIDANQRSDLIITALELCSADVGRLTTKVYDLEQELEQYAHCSPLKHALKLLFRPITRAASKMLRRIRQKSDLELLSVTDLFDPVWYEDRFPDVKSGSMDPALHFLLHGGREGRPASPLFDTSNYLFLNPDLRDMDINPLIHFLRVGRNQGRVAMTLDGHSVEER